MTQIKLMFSTFYGVTEWKVLAVVVRVSHRITFLYKGSWTHISSL